MLFCLLKFLVSLLHSFSRFSRGIWEFHGFNLISLIEYPDTFSVDMVLMLDFSWSSGGAFVDRTAVSHQSGWPLFLLPDISV